MPYNQNNLLVLETATMSYLVLSDATRQNLEQERSRLINDRQKIVSEIESSVRAEVDRTLKALNALLSESSEVKAVPADDIVKAVNELLDHADATSTQPTSRSRKTGTRKAESEDKEQSTSGFDAKQLKRKFKGNSLIDAIVQLMQQDTAKVYALDDLIAGVYDKFDEAEMPRARKTLGATLMHANRAGTVKRVGEKPSRYKLGY